MNRDIIRTDQAPAAIGPYSQGIIAAPWIFVSGQLGMKPETGELVGPDFAAQARQAIENMAAILRAGGSGLDRVVSVDVYLTDLSRFAEFNAVYLEYFGEYKPARAAVGVNRLPKDAFVEIRCIALKS